MPRGLRFSTAVHRTFSNNFRTRKNPISQARKRPGSYPILPPPRAIPNPIPTTPKPDLPLKTGDPGLKTGYFLTLERSGPNDHQMEAKRPPFRTHHGTTLPPPVQPLQIPPRRSARPAQTGRNGRRLLRNGSIIADIIMSSSIALQACLGRCV